MKTILTSVPDVMFETRITDAVRAMGHRAEAFRAQSEQNADLAIVGLENNREWQSVVQAARARNVPVLAFGRHTSVELLRQARQAGCTRVVVNSDIAEKLPHLLDEMLSIPTSNL